jgi:signal-transduction protein with cAMP-binding, CBS, and nucleotidyltransferase domain
MARAKASKKTSGRMVQDVMTPNPMMLSSTVPIRDAARAMRDANIGSVIVGDGQELHGVLTDRDIVVRGVAEGRDLAATQVVEICSREITSVGARDSVADALAVMRARAVRRLPVVDNGRTVGILSLGDLALDRDPQSVLAVLGEISAAPPNH